MEDVAGAIVYIDPLVDRDLIEDGIIRALRAANSGDRALDPDALVRVISGRWLDSSDVSSKTSTADVADAILSGDTALVVDGSDRVVVVKTRGWKSRAIQEAKTGPTVRGPRDGLTELLSTNISLVRQRLRTANLRVSFRTHITKLSRQDLAVLHIDGIANPDIIG